MAPIYDTDIAEERFEQEQWRTFELWEKVARRLARKRDLWIGATIIVFLAIAAIPVIKDQSPAWEARKAATRVAMHFGSLRTRAATEHVAFELGFTEEAGHLVAVLVSRPRCGTFDVLGREALDLGPGLSVVPPRAAADHGIQGARDQICYDPLDGIKPNELSAILVAPSQDLETSGSPAVKRLTREDRFSTLLISGESAEMSIH